MAAPRTAWGHLPEVSVTARGPFAVGSLLWRDARGALMCTLVAKATYELIPGESPPADVPLPLQEADAHWDDDPARSVHQPADLVPFKGAAEVVVVGSAFAPGERPARSVIARVVVGSVDKAVECFPPRRFRLDGVIDDASPQVRFSLRWEHAAGGPGSDNPAGIDIARGDVRGRHPIPPLLPPSFALGAPGDHIPTIGLGPIAASWPTRLAGLGPHERAWVRRPAASPLPPTLPPRAFQVGAEDQWLDRPLVANERVVLENLHEDNPRLVMSLSGLEPYALCAGQPPVRLQGDLLFIDTERTLCTLTFRAQIALGEDIRKLRVVVIGRAMGEAVSAREIARLLDEAGASAIEVHDAADMPRDAVVSTTALPMAWMAPRAALPFAYAEAQPRPGRASIPDGALPFRGDRESPPPIEPTASPSASPVATLAAPLHLPPAPAPFAIPAPPAPVIAPPAPVIAPPSFTAPASASLSVGQQSTADKAPPPPAMIALGRDPLTSSAPAMRSAEPEPGASKPAEKPPSKPSSFDAAFGKSKPATKPASSFDAAFGKSKPAPAKPAGFDSAFGGSARSASDAAADKEREKEPAPRVEVAKPVSDAPRRLTVVDLLHHDPKVASRLRTMKRFAPLWAQASTRLRAVGSVDEPRAETATPDRDRADVLRVLSYARPVDLAAVRAALPEGLDEHGDLDPPVVLVAGELRPTFDEIETLRTTVAVAQPVAGGDKRLLAAITVAQEALAAPVPPRADATLGLARQIEQSSLALSLPPRYVAAEVERLLLEHRRWKRRALLGESRVRAELTLPDGEVLIAYLPDAAAGSLPLLMAYPVMALCEPRPREDVTETREEALILVAIGRILKTRAEPAERPAADPKGA